ncbi:hypothetical protein CLOM_g7794 [Closterium sp. NIES-68]|nr:hypothetical protein CLOM_g7794 [Closterium sp. NIES-68]GJP59881.1 hypothetical protein CLOP_g15674 [Closterium sp. NIES-67]
MVSLFSPTPPAVANDFCPLSFQFVHALAFFLSQSSYGINLFSVCFSFCPHQITWHHLKTAAEEAEQQTQQQQRKLSSRSSSSRGS